MEIEDQRSISQNPENGNNFELLQKTMSIMTILENEYLELMEEQEELLSNPE